MKCRITNILTHCEYASRGITNIRLIDIDDFIGLRFDSDANYDQNYITTVLHNNEQIHIDTPASARYTMNMNTGEYTHTIETFVKDLSSDLTKQLHLATKRRFIVIFDTNRGRSFLFGYRHGASLVYTNQTESITGSLVTLTINTRYPLFEVMRDAPSYEGVYDIDFDSALCESSVHELSNYICENE